MKQSTKRIIAFLIDMLLVLVLANLISNSYTFNPYVYDYEDIYEEYNEVYESVYEDFSLEAITEENVHLLSEAMYKIERVNVYYYLYYLVFVFIYFVIFQWMNKGQTLGKKLMKLRVLSDDETDVNIIQYGVRYLFNGSIFIMGFHLTLLIKTIVLFVDVGASLYMNIYTVLTIIGFILEGMFLFSIIKSSDGRLLNDRIAKTKVVEE